MKLKNLFALLLIMSTYIAASDSTIWNDSIVIDDSTGWNDTVVIDDSTGWDDSTVIDDSTGWDDSTVIDDSTGWDDSTVIDDSTGWDDSTVIDDSTGWDDSTVIDDSTGWDDTLIIDDSIGWLDTNYYDDSLDYIYDSTNGIGLKLFWDDPIIISINDISIEVQDSPWGKLILDSEVLKEIILNISNQNKGLLDSSWISVKLSDSRNRETSSSLKIAYLNEETQNWETVNSSIDAKNQHINAYIPPTSRIAVIEGGNITPIDNTIGVNKNLSNLSIRSNNILFTINKDAKVSLELLSMRGQKVATLISGYKSRGSYNINSQKLNSLAKGNYILSFKINNQVSASKLFSIR